MPRWLTWASLVVAVSAWAVAYGFDSAIAAVIAIAASAVALWAVLRVSTHREAPSQRSHTPTSGADEPATPTPVHVSPEFGPPVELSSEATALALLKNADLIGTPVAASIWFLDDSTSTLRLIESQGSMCPPNQPVPLATPILGAALDRDRTVFDDLERVTVGGQTTVVRRFAMPVSYGDVRAVAGVDFTDDPPGAEDLAALADFSRLPIASAVALYLAQERMSAARSLLENTRDLSRMLDEESVLDTTLKRAMDMSHAATGSIMLLGEDASLRIELARGLPEHVVESTAVSVGEGIAGWVAASGQPVLVEDLPGRGKPPQRHGVRSSVAVPIADDEGLIGVLNVGSRRYPARFTERHLEDIEVLARQCAVALRNARAVAASGDLYFDTVRALTLALETKDPYAAGATDRVVEFTDAIGAAMDLDADETQALRIASMLHDIGMLTAGDSVMESTAPLSTVERGLIKMHPTVAADILRQIPAMREVIPIVYHHHERYDGQGYSDGIAGEDIPLAARILAVADAYVAMTSDRPYRRALNSRDAALELRDKAGTQFDPDVVRTFLEILGSDSNRVPERDA